MRNNKQIFRSHMTCSLLALDRDRTSIETGCKRYYIYRSSFIHEPPETATILERTLGSKIEASILCFYYSIFIICTHRCKYRLIIPKSDPKFACLNQKIYTGKDLCIHKHKQTHRQECCKNMFYGFSET